MKIEKDRSNERAGRKTERVRETRKERARLYYNRFSFFIILILFYYLTENMLLIEIHIIKNNNLHFLLLNFKNISVKYHVC